MDYGKISSALTSICFSALGCTTRTVCSIEHFTTFHFHTNFKLAFVCKNAKLYYNAMENIIIVWFLFVNIFVYL